MHNWNGAVTLKTKVKGTVEREKKKRLQTVSARH